MAVTIKEVWDFYKAAVAYLVKQYFENTCEIKDNIIAALLLIIGFLLSIIFIAVRLCCCCTGCWTPNYQKIHRRDEREAWSIVHMCKRERGESGNKAVTQWYSRNFLERRLEFHFSTKDVCRSKHIFVYLKLCRGNKALPYKYQFFPFLLAKSNMASKIFILA